MEKNVEVIQSAGDYSIINLYGILMKSVDGSVYIGSIYSTLEELKEEYPTSDYVQGYGILDNRTGWLDEESDDWYDTLKEAMQALIIKLGKK